MDLMAKVHLKSSCALCMDLAYVFAYFMCRNVFSDLYCLNCLNIYMVVIGFLDVSN